MAASFGAFKDIHDVARTYQVRVAVEPFMQPSPFPVDERFQKEMLFTLGHLDVRMSEASVGEFLIAPVLREIWKAYTDSLLFWSHVSLEVGEEFTGVPDYLFTRRTALGLVRDKPYLLVVETKKDDFEKSWGQCLAALVAAQKLNGSPSLTLHGCVSNGLMWEFGRLEGTQFTQELRSYTLTSMTDLFAALNYLFEQVKQQALAA